VIENVDWSLDWIEFGDVSLDVVEAVLVCPVESVSPHELVQITGHLADCRSVHGFKSWLYQYCRYWKILENTGNTSIADTGRFWKILVIPVLQILED
jgi:hypothetical protein